MSEQPEATPQDTPETPNDPPKACDSLAGPDGVHQWLYDEHMQKLREDLKIENPNTLRAILALHSYKGRGDNFDGLLMLLISKADSGNKRSLCIAFPYHVRVFDLWYGTAKEEEFFKYLGLPFKI